MRVYIIQSKKKIEPFSVEIGSILIKNKELGVLQKEAFLNLKLEPITIKYYSEINDSSEYVVLDEDLYFEVELLKEFIDKSRKLGRKTVCALKSGVFTLRTISYVQETKKQDNYIEYNLWYYPSKNLRENVCKPIVFNPDEVLESIHLPKHICESGRYAMPLTKKVIIQINHWSNLWAANLSSVLAMLSRLSQTNKIKIMSIVLKTCSTNRWKISSLLNDIGKDCDIHPTAYIEGSVVGNNVIIGAGAVVRGAIIGDNSFVGNGVVIETSVVGENCTILNGHILYSVLYPSVFTVTHMISASLIGGNSFIGSGAVLTDFRLDGKTMFVMKEGKKVDSGNIFLGCCLGDDVYLGSGCIVAPGRIIPSGSRVSLGKGRIITSISNDDEGEYQII